MELQTWVFQTEGFKKMLGQDGGSRGVDNDFFHRAMSNNGAWIIGRNMFSPLRGAWKDDSWKGWWGDNPPYHVPVFVLTHHARKSMEMQGGTTFHFITEGPEAALSKAKEAAKGKDVRIGGGVATIRQYLKLGAIDEMHLAVSPVVLGEGENLYTGINLSKLGFKPIQTTAGEGVMHVVLKRS